MPDQRRLSGATKSYKKAFRLHVVEVLFGALVGFYCLNIRLASSI